MVDGIFLLLLQVLSCRRLLSEYFTSFCYQPFTFVSFVIRRFFVDQIDFNQLNFRKGEGQGGGLPEVFLQKQWRDQLPLCY